MVWAATGIWHGASWNYVIWGLYFFVLLLVDKAVAGRLLEKLPRVIQHIYTLFFVLVSWAIFALEDFGQLGAYLKVMFGMGGVPLTDGTFGYYLTSYLPILCAAAVASTNLGRVLYGKLRPRAAQAVCAGPGDPGAGDLHRVSGGRDLQSLPVFPILRRRIVHEQHNFNLLLTVLFCLFIGGMFLGSLILPDRAFSQLENRNLEQAPKISLEAIDTGKFMEDAEDYVNDQIIGRDFWVALKAWSERVSGKQENNGVYFAKENTLISRVDTPSWEDTPAQGVHPAQQGLQTRVGYVNALVDNVDVPVYFGIIPSAAEIWVRPASGGGSHRRREGHHRPSVQCGPDPYHRSVFRPGSAQGRGPLLPHRPPLDQPGAYYGYTALMDAMGLEAVPLDESQKVTVSEDFYGTRSPPPACGGCPRPHRPVYLGRGRDGYRLPQRYPGAGQPLCGQLPGGQGQVLLLPGGQQAPVRHRDGAHRRPPKFWSSGTPMRTVWPPS